MAKAELSGVILAGGKNRRMGGEDKAFIKIEGKEIIRRTLDLFRDVFPEVLIVTNSPERYRKFKGEALVVADVFKNKGPLGGIHSGLAHISKEAGFFVACDMPFLERDLIEKQIKLYEEKNCPCLVASCAGKLEPLHAIYAKEVIRRVESFIEAKQLSLKDVIPRLEGKELFEVGKKKKSSFRNLNTLLDALPIDCGFRGRKKA